MTIIRAVIDKLDVVVITDHGRFRCGPDGFIHGPNVFPGAPRHQITPTIYWEWMERKGDWTYCPPERVRLEKPWLDVPADWRANLDAIFKASRETGNFNR